MYNTRLLYIVLLFLTFDLSAQFSIGDTTIIFMDASRSRNISTLVCYPTNTDGSVATGPFPVVVFGHGFQIPHTSYDWLKTALVPKGYIILYPSTEGGLSPNHTEFGLDLSFLVDEMQTNPPALLSGEVASTSAIMGHSMGGGVTYLAADGNANVTTTITFAAADTNPSAIPAADNITVPSLVVAAENDCIVNDDPFVFYDTLSSSYVSYIEIGNGTHCDFSDGNFACSFGQLVSGCNTGIGLAQQHLLTTAVICEWLDYYLTCDYVAMNNYQSLVSGLPNADYSDYEETGTVASTEIPVITGDPTMDANVSGTYTFQWFLDGNVIPGATNSTYTAIASGTYCVDITNTDACSHKSAPVIISIPLDVELIQFKGRSLSNDTILLHWVAGSETDFKHYVLQHSRDAITFTALGVVHPVPGEGEKSYDFIHLNPSIGKHYYRLKMVDIDEQFDYSGIVVVTLTSSNQITIRPLPNPAIETCTLHITTTQPSLYLIRVVDTNGQLVLEDMGVSDGGTVTHPLDVRQWDAGMYFGQWFSGMKSESFKIVKNR